MINWGEELATIRHRYGQRVGVVDSNGCYSIAQIIDHAAGIADYLRSLGVGPRDFIATVFPNLVTAVSASYAVALTGAAEVPLNPLLSEFEFAHTLRCTGAKFILVDGQTDSMPELEARKIDVRQIASRPMNSSGWPEVAPSTPSRIVFTSGTTGLPKGAIHTHRGRWTGTLLLRASLPLLPDRSNRILLMTPFSHGSSLLTFAYIAHGASVHLMNGVDPETVLPLLASGSITEMFAPPTVLAKLTEAAADPKYAEVRPRLRMILTGTAPLTPPLYRKAAAEFGEIIRVTYGKSEIFNPITVLEPPETAAAYSEVTGEGLCVGWPATGVRIEIRDERNNVLLPGHVGQIYLFSPHMFSGYMTPEGVRLLRPGEFHESGDIGYLDELGRLYLVARQSDIMKTGGYKVSPGEVERFLAPALPGTELIVLGFPSEYWGEIITVVAENPPEDWRERLEPVLATLTAYKRPRLFASVDALPRNSIGKISRASLRSKLLEKFDLIERPRPAFIEKQRSGDGRS